MYTIESSPHQILSARLMVTERLITGFDDANPENAYRIDGQHIYFEFAFQREWYKKGNIYPIYKWKRCPLIQLYSTESLLWHLHLQMWIRVSNEEESAFPCGLTYKVP